MEMAVGHYTGSHRPYQTEMDHPSDGHCPLTAVLRMAQSQSHNNIAHPLTLLLALLLRRESKLVVTQRAEELPVSRKYSHQQQCLNLNPNHDDGIT